MDPLSSHAFSTELIIFFIALIACALLSFLETSITTLRLFNLQQLLKTNTRYKNLLQTLESEPQKILITILIANNIASVTSGALMTNFMESIFVNLNMSRGLGFTFGIAIATAAQLVIGEVIPKNIAQVYSERFFQSTLWIVNTIYLILSPLARILSSLSNFIIKRFHTDAIDSGNAVVSEKEIQFLIDYINKKGLMDTDKTQMLHSVFDLGHTSVREIMVPELDIILIDVNTSLDDALKLFCTYHFSRLPVYEGNTDNIIGILHQKDIFLMISSHQNNPLREIIRPIMFVPESTKVNQLLRQFKQQRHHIAMVLNEFGGIIGLVTLEDAIEEIVGDINDEHESISEDIIQVHDEQGGWLVYAGVDLERLEKLLDIYFDVEDAVTLGGFIIERLQYLPQKGEQLSYRGYTLQINRATPKRIVQVLIFKEIKSNV